MEHWETKSHQLIREIARDYNPNDDFMIGLLLIGGISVPIIGLIVIGIMTLVKNYG